MACLEALVHGVEALLVQEGVRAAAESIDFAISF